MFWTCLKYKLHSNNAKNSSMAIRITVLLPLCDKLKSVLRNKSMERFKQRACPSTIWAAFYKMVTWNDILWKTTFFMKGITITNKYYCPGKEGEMCQLREMSDQAFFSLLQNRKLNEKNLVKYMFASCIFTSFSDCRFIKPPDDKHLSSSVSAYAVSPSVD